MKYKRLLILLFIVVLLVSFLFPASAAENYISLKNLMDPMNSSDFFNVYVTTTFGTDVFLSYSWWTDNILRFSQPAQSGTYNKLRLVSIQPNSDPYMISDGDVLYMNCGYWILTDLKEVKTGLDLTYDIVVGFVDKSGNAYSVTVLADAKGDYSFQDGRVGIFFEFQYTFPSYAHRLTYLTYEFNFPDTETTILQLGSDGRTQFYLGNSQNAPVFDGVNKDSLDEMKGSEDKLVSDTLGGREEVEHIFDSAEQALSTGSAMVQGAMVISSVISSVIAKLGLSPILYASLALGIVAFILGTSQILVSSASGSAVRRADREARAQEAAERHEVRQAAWEHHIAARDYYRRR